MQDTGRTEYLALVLRQILEGKASGVLLKRLVERLSGCPDNEAELKQRIDKTRVAVRMFVSEDLAEEVYRRLLTEAGIQTVHGSLNENL